MHPSAWALARVGEMRDAATVMRRYLWLLVLAMTATGCSTTEVSDPVVDGWPVGPEVSCEGIQRCPELLEVATDTLDRRDPEHAAIVGVTLHAEGTLVDANGDHILTVRSGACCYVARFQLADSSVRAIGVGSVGVDPQIRGFDTGP